MIHWCLLFPGYLIDIGEQMPRVQSIAPVPNRTNIVALSIIGESTSDLDSLDETF